MRAADGSRGWWPTRAAWITSFAAAAAFTFSFPLSESFVAGWPLVFAWPLLMARAATCAPSARSAAVAVFVPFFLAFLAHQWWMREVTALGMPILVAYLAAWMALHGLMLRALSGTLDAPRLPFAVTLPATLVAVEFLRGDLVCTGYAWFFAAHPLVEWTMLAQCASLGGGWLLTALAAAVGGAALDALGRRGARPSMRRWASPAAVAVAMAGALGYGVSRQATLQAADRDARRTELLVVQTNLPMSNKLAWAPEAQVEDFIDFAQLTLQGATEARRPIDAALWPETMVPGLGLEPQALGMLEERGLFPGSRFADALRDLSRRIDAPLIVGSPSFIGLRVEGNRFAWDAHHNSAYLVDAGGAQARTDKIFLTPFGETMPIISRSDWLEERLLALGADGMTFDLEEADAPTILMLDTADGPVQVGVPICFEITAPWASRRIAFDGGARAAEVLVNLSNDGWFAGSGAGRRQHLQVSQLRAIELATPVVRAANTGISASIDAAGEVRGTVAAKTAGTLVASVALASAVPVAATVGDGVAWTALALVALGLLARASRSRRKMPDTLPRRGR
jgi:apolipoprotein N-acyltransferase